MASIIRNQIKQRFLAYLKQWYNECFVFNFVFPAPFFEMHHPWRNLRNLTKTCKAELRTDGSFGVINHPISVAVLQVGFTIMLPGIRWSPTLPHHGVLEGLHVQFRSSLSWLSLFSQVFPVFVHVVKQDTFVTGPMTNGTYWSFDHQCQNLFP